MKKLTLEDALTMVPQCVAHGVSHDEIPDDIRMATAKTIQFLSTVDKPGSIGSPDLKFAAWLLERSGWKNGTAN